MVTHYYGIKLGHRQAIELTDCRPDGATLESVAKALKDSHGLRSRALRSKAQIRTALRNGLPVMTNDDLNDTGFPCDSARRRDAQGILDRRPGHWRNLLAA